MFKPVFEVRSIIGYIHSLCQSLFKMSQVIRMYKTEGIFADNFLWFIAKYFFT